MKIKPMLAGGFFIRFSIRSVISSSLSISATGKVNLAK
jgi:hypothetical protein